MPPARSRFTHADAIWRVLSDFGAACQYLAMVVKCTVKVEGIGALRTLTYVNGSTIVERLESLDAAAHRLSYALLTGAPFRDCMTTVTVYGLGPGQCGWRGRRAFARRAPGE